MHIKVPNDVVCDALSDLNKGETLKSEDDNLTKVPKLTTIKVKEL